MKILGTNEERGLPIKLEFNSSKYHEFGIPIEGRKNKSYCLGDNTQLNDTIGGHIVSIKRKRDTLIIRGENDGSSFEGKLLKLPKPELNYQQTIDPATFTVSEINIREYYNFVRIGEWIFKEGNKTKSITFNPEINIKPSCSF